MAEGAELDLSFHEYENEAIPENPQTEQEPEQGLDQGQEQGLEHGLEQELEQGLEQGLEQELEQGLEQEQEHEDASVPRVSGGGERWPGWPGESVFRMVVPSQKVGGLIGRKGENIKRICEETKARIKVFDGPPRSTGRAVMVSAKEDPDASNPPAIHGLLEVHKRVVGLENDSQYPPPSEGTKVSTRLLVPASQAGNLIGKQGATVKSIQEAAKCIVRVLGTEDLPVFALQDDRIVEVVGEAAAVHKAVELVASQLRKFLVDRSIIPIIESQMNALCSQIERMPPPPQSWGPPPQGFPPSTAGGPRYGGDHHFMPPPRQHDGYYPPAAMPPPMQHDGYFPPAEMPPPVEKQRHQGISAYGREPPMAAANAPLNQPAPSMVTQVKQHIQIPLSYADAVIGNNGASISYIRRASGATVTIQESRGAPGEMTVEINGTASQVQTAQQLIQNCMAEAAGAAQTQAGAPTDQGYNPYAPQATMYSAPPPTQPDLSGQTGGYGPVYGTNYGY